MISDTHEQHSSACIEECDLLIHAGDITYRGEKLQYHKFMVWVEDLLDLGIVKKDVVFIAGNHDLTLEQNPSLHLEVFPYGTYLYCSKTTVTQDQQALTVYGIPHQLEFGTWAFGTNEQGLAKLLSEVPEGVDILVTHGPPKGVLDKNKTGDCCGSQALLDWIKSYKPKLVVCGHIHESYGTQWVDNTLVVNASTCNAKYKPINEPIYVDIDKNNHITVLKYEELFK